MVSKTNAIKNELTEAELLIHMDSAFDSLNKSRLNASTAIAHLFLVHLATKSGMAKKWFDARVADYEIMVEDNNAEVDARFEEADNFLAGKLSIDHEAVKKPSTPEEKKAQEELIAKLKADAVLETKERRKLRYVSIKDRENSNDFVKLVRIGFHLYYASQGAHVTRSCYALEWIKNHFASLPTPTVDDIVNAIETNGGFEAIVEQQRSIKDIDGSEVEIRKIWRDAIMSAAREKVRTLPSMNRFEMKIRREVQGFSQLLVRVDGDFVEVIGEADAPDVEIESAVNRVGSMLKIDTDPGTEFAGRVLEAGELVAAGQKITAEDGKTTIATTSRIMTMRPDSSGAPEVVVSANWTEAGPVLIAQPSDFSIMGVNDRYVVVRPNEYKKLAKLIRDTNGRSQIVITPERDPKTAEGGEAKSPMSWRCENIAITTENQRRQQRNKGDKILPAVTQVYWGDFDEVSYKPLDLEGFSPQLAGSLTAADIAAILDLFPKPEKFAKAAEGTEKESAGKAKGVKLPRFVTLKFGGNKLTVEYGDADPLELDCATDAKGIVTVMVRPQDLLGILNFLQKRDCQKLTLEPDDRVLVKFSWQDSFGHYGMHYPTCGTDGRYQSRRVAPMRVVLPPIPIAAE